MQITVLLHGENGESEYGRDIMPIREAMAYIELLKSVDWFSRNDDNLIFKESTLYLDQDPAILNIYTRKV